MSEYIIVHDHEYGQSIHRLRIKTEIPAHLLMDEHLKKLANTVGIDFEPDKDEGLSLHKLTDIGQISVLDFVDGEFVHVDE